MGCDYGVALALFENDVWLPHDQIGSYWYRRGSDFYYSESGDVADPDDWDGGGYASERVRSFVTAGDYVLVSMDDCSGGKYQAIFKRDMEIKNE
jgi:hypothetical protein